MKGLLAFCICLAVLACSCSKKEESKQQTAQPSSRLASIDENKAITPQFDWAGKFSEELRKVCIRGKWGYIDEMGKVVIAPQFDFAEGFSKGLARVKINDKWGYIDKMGKMVIAPQFDYAKDFSEGLARVLMRNKWGFIDEKGNLIVAPQFDRAEDFAEGLARVIIDFSHGKHGYIDKKGNLVIAPQFDWAGDFSEGLAPIMVEGGKRGYIDTTGKMVIMPQYFGAGDFSEGLALVLIDWDGDWVYIDKTGKTVSDTATIRSTRVESEIFYQIGEKRNVLARSGLNLKEAPTPSARTLKVVPYGERVFIAEDKNERVPFEAEGISGHWVLVNYATETGYIFDGFLSKLPAPPNSCHDLMQYADQKLGRVGKREEIVFDDCECNS